MDDLRRFEYLAPGAVVLCHFFAGILNFGDFLNSSAPGIAGAVSSAALLTIYLAASLILRGRRLWRLFSLVYAAVPLAALLTLADLPNRLSAVLYSLAICFFPAYYGLGAFGIRDVRSLALLFAAVQIPVIFYFFRSIRQKGP